MSLMEAESYDERWTVHRNRPRNNLALSIRHHITKTFWFDFVITMCTIGVGVITVRVFDYTDVLIICFLLVCSRTACLNHNVSISIKSTYLRRKNMKYH
jgi:hypothetical protein